MNSDTIISLFSGAGGLSLGFKAAGMAPRLGVELNPDASMSYRTNLDTECLQHDIGLAQTADEIVKFAGTGARRPLAIIGGPPCQGFSTAGLRLGDDPRNRLIFSYLRVVSALQPSWVLFENVEGLLTSNGGTSVRDFVHELTSLGYWVALQKINFAAFGLPQARKRVIIVANNLRVDYEFPELEFSFDGQKHRSDNGLPKGPSLKDAFAGLGSVAANLTTLSRYAYPIPKGDYDARMRGSNDGEGVTQHFSQRLSPADVERARLLMPGQTLKHLPEEIWPESYRSRAYRRVIDGMPTERRGGAPAGMKRLDPSLPSLTITSLSSRELIHPNEHRPLSLRECARLQSFPDTFIFSGNVASIARQIGNAFPPLAAEALALSIIEQHNATRSKRMLRGEPRLTNYRLTDSSGKSPALQQTDLLLSQLMAGGKPTQLPFLTMNLEERDLLHKLNATQKSLITRARRADPIVLSDRELARLVSVMLHDVNREDLIPTFVKIPSDYKGYYHLPLSWFQTDEQRPFDFAEWFLKWEAQIESFDTVFQCLCEIHKRRRKYDIILRGQPRPTMDQVARRGLLEYGIVESPALTSWLVWRKWIYDIDNRSAQETGYLFEPILARALGGTPFGSRNSPIKRENRSGGRQVDCLIDAEGERRAYEFKVRFTIASSGQGRFAEEKAFPKEANAAGFTPVLIVLDPTPNEKMNILIEAFKANGGEAYSGEAAWRHISERAGDTMSAFLAKYVREPIEAIVNDEESHPLGALTLAWDVEDEKIKVTVGDQSWLIDRSQEIAFEEQVDALESSANGNGE